MPKLRGFKFVATVAGLGLSAQGWALSLDAGPVSFQLDSFVTLGAAIRTESRDRDLVGKVNNFPGLCTRSTQTGDPNAGQPTAFEYMEPQEGDIGSTCNSTSNPELNMLYVRTPGSFNINGDDGNLNFDKGDLVNANIKLTSDLGVSFDFDNRWLSWANEFSLFARGIWFYDDVYNEYAVRRPDTTLQPAKTIFPRDYEEQLGTRFDLLDAYVSAYLPFIGGRSLSLKVGRQGLNWGESTALALNSINTVNPPDSVRLRMPGFDLAELFQSVGMVTFATDISLNIALEGFYQYEWLPVVVEAPGSFYSASDVLGGSNKGGEYAMLSFGKAPEDPYNVYRSEDNPDDPFALGSAGGRTVYRLPDVEPPGDGQYGFKLAYFAENFNNGTEFALYFANYHSRIPSVNLIAADETCGVNATNAAQFANDCGAGQGSIGSLNLSEEPLPVDTVKLYATYAEDIQMYGFSFNTTIGDWAWSGEYSFRPNHPVQIHTVDLLFAALQPAFPINNVTIAPGTGSIVPGEIPIDISQLPTDVPGNGIGVVFPSRRIAVPDYVQSVYRGKEVTPGMHIKGYEEMKQGQLSTTLLKIFGGDNPLKASQIILLMETGFTHIVDMPSLNELQFQGAGSDTHASNGADGTRNGVRDSAAVDSPYGVTGMDTNGDGDTLCARGTYITENFGTVEAEPCRQNPTASNADRFGDEFSAGVRILSFIRYQDFFAGINFEPLIGLFYDFYGNGPGLGQNFAEGNFTGLLGLRFDYLSKYFWELRYTALDGAYNPRSDRDTLSLTLRYEF